MSYIKHHLLEDERILFQTKKHWIVFFPAIIALLISLYVSDNIIFPKLALIPYVMTLWLFGTTAIDYFFSEYAVTNHRVIMKEGLIWRASTAEKLSAVAKTELYQSILGRCLGYGKLIVFGFGGTNYYSTICQPTEFQRQIQGRLQTSSATQK